MAFEGGLFDVFDEVSDEKPCQSFAVTNEKRSKFQSVACSSSGVDDSCSEPAAKRSRTDQDVAVVKEGHVFGSHGLPSVVEVETVEACTHEVALPHGYTYIPLTQKSSEPAKTYKFILDPFQKEALKCVESNESVLVSAHTSAGKTVVAEYAVAVSLRDRQRVIYTTPIKALSNQKFREMTEEFKDVGLMTGDVTINPSASVLVMTTEILRSMLYRGSEVMREVGWVIFDEIHYMRDKERGVVWEETIILLPGNVRYVFLSATIPNARQFAQWIAQLHQQPCHVVYTDFRPTPLQHYIFPAGADGLYLVVDEQREFREANFLKAMSLLKDSDGGDVRGGKGAAKDSSNIFKIIRMIMERSYQPVIIFSFSKKDCEAYAMQLSKLDFNTDEEKKLVEDVFRNAIDALSEEDQHLPQVEHVLPLLKRGIGIHHGGLLPILKETIEILFGEGLVKALFATETFALGLNMPARTVVFTGARKFDGKDFRWVTGGEYIQMSGRAGRRGLDDKGIVMLMVDKKMEPDVGKALVKGTPDPLNSAFRLTYNMVLNLLRVEEINPEYMLERSFLQFQNSTTLPELERKGAALEKELAEVVVPREEEITSYYMIRQRLDQLGKDFRSVLNKPRYVLPFLQPGRLLQIVNGKDDYGWAVLVNKKSSTKKGQPDSDTMYTADVLLQCASGANHKSGLPPPCLPGGKGEVQILSVSLSLIAGLSSIRLYLPKDLRSVDNCLGVMKSVREVKRRFPDGVPFLDPFEDMNIKDDAFRQIVLKIESLEKRLHSHPLHKDPELETLFAQCGRKMALAEKVKLAKKSLRQAQNILHLDELKSRKRVLRRLGYASPADVIEMKGRVACEISSGDELVLTEMIFNGAFNNLSVEQTTALLSCFVFEEKVNKKSAVSEELAGPLRMLQETARRVARVSVESKLELDEENYVSSFNSDMMDIVYAWSKNASFANICKMTDAYEGSIIRCFRRLEELLRQMAAASKAIGNQELEVKFSTGITRIKRDIVFAASLYL